MNEYDNPEGWKIVDCIPAGTYGIETADGVVFGLDLPLEVAERIKAAMVAVKYIPTLMLQGDRPEEAYHFELFKAWAKYTAVQSSIIAKQALTNA